MLLRRLSVAHGEGGLSAIAAFMTYSTQQIQLTSKKGVARPILARPTSRGALGAPSQRAHLPSPLPPRPLAPPVRAAAPSPATEAALPPTWAGGTATPTCSFPQPLGRPAASLVVARPQQFPFRLHGVMEKFQLGLLEHEGGLEPI